MYLTASLAPAAGRRLAGQFRDMAQAAEAAALDAVWLGHCGGDMMLDPLPLLGSLAAVTSRIGLGAAWSLDHSEPFHVARVFATLDHLTSGRTAWLFGHADDRALFRHVPVRSAAEASQRADEFIEVAGALWDSWEDEAFLLDVPTGRFADPARVHPIHHAGPHFTVRGPLNVPRPPQGAPVLAQAPTGSAANPAAEVLLVSPDEMAALRLPEVERQQRILVNIALADMPDPIGFMSNAIARAECHGFNLIISGAEALASFADQIVPSLRALSLRPPGYEGTTLREHLDLPRARSRFAA